MLRPAVMAAAPEASSKRPVARSWTAGTPVAGSEVLVVGVEGVLRGGVLGVEPSGTPGVAVAVWFGVGVSGT